MVMIQKRYWETFFLALVHCDHGILPDEPPPLEEPREQVRLLGTHLFTCLLPTLAFILLYPFKKT